MGRRRKHENDAAKQRAYLLQKNVSKENIVTQLEAIGWKFLEDDYNYHLRGPKFGLGYTKDDWGLVVAKVEELEQAAKEPPPEIEIVDIWKRKKTNGESNDPGNA